ncbi:unnamed protein product [Rhizoctonia solani]|uniref:Autophagy-related protein n=1 Tax=Rhizoctonia solani TaxID=456999 RepID=A0A8H2XHZ7_9AGAM|nr:unnamed protein product [Rhizoctonia solani]
MQTVQETDAQSLDLQHTKNPEAPSHPVLHDFKHVEDVFDIETDPKWQTSKRELWSYYLYYVGNNGLAGFNYGPSQFQNLLYLAGYDRAQSPYAAPCEGDAVCVLPFMGKVRDISSIVLITNGIAFAIQAVLFLVIGAWADYGSWRPNITIAFTVVAIAVAFAWLGVLEPSKWEAGVALYMLGLITYQGALTFWTAAFPGLARSLPEMQESKRALDAGETTLADHQTLDSLSRNRLSNVSFTICSAGEIVLLAVMVGMLKGMHADSSPEANTKAFSALIALSGGFWLICAIPWGDVLNTCVTVIGTLQNSLASYSTLQLTYLLIVGIAAQMVGIYVFWLVQKRFKISTKKMLLFNAFWILMLCGWGLIGIWTTRFGFQHLWEIWAYQAFYGVFVCPWYAYSQTMISEVVPKGKEFLFFAMFSVIGKTSSFIGPFVSSAIIDDSNNNNMPFAFLLGLGVFSFMLLILVDVDKSRVECTEYLAAEARLEGIEDE